MILDIKPLHDELSDCFEELLISVAAWWGRGYEFMFVDTWSFDYLSRRLDETAPLNRRIRPWPGGNHYPSLEKYYGIKLIRHDTRTADEVTAIINQELSQDRPAAIYIDSFWCPWNPDYQKAHYRHYCLAVGFNEPDRSIYCIDPSYSEKREKLTRHNLAAGCGRSVTFSIVHDQLMNIDWREVVSDAVRRALGGAFTAIRNFAAELGVTDLINENTNGGRDSYSALFVCFVEIGAYRQKIARILRTLSERNNIGELLAPAVQLEQIGDIWHKVGSIMVKITKKIASIKRVNSLAALLGMIADTEEGIALELLKIIEKYS